MQLETLSPSGANLDGKFVVVVSGAVRNEYARGGGTESNVEQEACVYGPGQSFSALMPGGLVARVRIQANMAAHVSVHTYLGYRVEI